MRYCGKKYMKGGAEEIRGGGQLESILISKRTEAELLE